MTNTTTTTTTLHDGDTAEPIGPATPEQVTASLEAGPTGFILVDNDGTVIVDGTWGSERARKAYVA